MNKNPNPASKEVLELTGQLEEMLRTAQQLSLLEKDLVKERLRKIYSLVDSMANRDETPSGNLWGTANTVNQELPPTVQEESIREQVMATLFSSKNSDSKGAEIIIETPEVTAMNTYQERGTENLKQATQRNPAPAEAGSANTSATIGNVEAKNNKTDLPIAEPGTLATQYKATETLADKIGKSEGGGVRLEEKLKHQPLGDLRQSIGINERFLFTNTFFGGNQQEYLQFIDRINTLHDFEEAVAYTRKNIHAGNSTPGHAEAMEHFEELLRRRFTP